MNWILAQCVMCYRNAAAQQLARSRVLNSGILILLIPPLLILGLILFLAYRKNKTLTTRAPAQVNDVSKPLSDMIADDHA
jgi:cytochrome c oxidase subunit IV